MRTRSIFQFENDDMLIAKAMQKPIFGWGGWGRNRVYDESGRDIAVTDGFWILVFGSNGYVGLMSMTLAMLLPVALVSAPIPSTDGINPLSHQWRYSSRSWQSS